MDDKYMTTNDVAEYLGITPGTVRNLVSKRQMPHFKCGKLFFKKDDIDRWMETKRVRTDAEVVEHVSGR